MEFQRSIGRKHKLNITPLIDVVFLLIVFFMLTTTFSRQESIELSFPSGAAATGENARPVIIVIAEQNRLFFRDQPIQPQELKTLLSESLSNNPKRKIMVMTTNNVSVQQVVDVMDKVYQAGGENIAVSYWKY